MSRRAASTLLLCLLGACGDDGSTPPADAGARDTSSRTDSGPPPALDFGCVGSVVWPTPTETELELSLVVTQVLSPVPVAGIEVSACARDDTTCAAPLFTAVSDAAGRVTGTVPLGTVGFDGYLDVRGSRFVPMLVFTTQPVASATSPLPQPSVLAEGTFAFLTGAAGVTPLEGRGHVVVNARDCAGAAAWGLRVDVSPAVADATAVYFVEGGTPDATATETDITGNAALLDLPPGPYTVTLTRVATGDVVATTDVFVRDGHLSAFVLDPTP